MTKDEARVEARKRREFCNPSHGVALAGHVLRLCPPPTGAVIGGFYPLPGEIDVLPLLRVLYNRGHTVVLPETPPKGNPLLFRRWDTVAPVLPGRYGTMHPTGELIQPDFVFVPLLGYDSTGNRLGFGGGYYDRTLASMPDAFRLGCGFEALEFDELPVEPHDVRLHGIATETGVTLFD